MRPPPFILVQKSNAPNRGETGPNGAVFRLGCAVSLSFSLLCLVVYEAFAPRLAALFISDPVTIGYGAGFLRCMVTAMPMMSVCYPMIIQFQAMGMVYRKKPAKQMP